MLKVVLTIDCERFISFKQGNPRWNKIEKFKGSINNLIKKFRYNEKGFEVVFNTIIMMTFVFITQVAHFHVLIVIILAITVYVIALELTNTLKFSQMIHAIRPKNVNRTA